MDFRSFPDLSLRAVSILKDSLDTPRAGKSVRFSLDTKK